MQILIIGAGQVGRSIANDLDQSHEIVVVERDADRCEQLKYELDVLTVNGDGTDLETLEEAGVTEADIVVASTDSDDTNIVVCSTAKALSDAFTVARIKRTNYLETWRRSHSAFGIDVLVCTNLLAAESIVRVIGLPAARDVDPFAGGLVRMAEFEVPEGSPVAGQTVQEADRFDSLTFAAIIRNDHVEIAKGDTRIEAADKLVVIGSPASVRGFAENIASEKKPFNEVVILGGSEIGFHVARLLCERGVKVRVIEQDPDRARVIAEELPDAVVLESDATDVDFLERERLGHADAFVSALDSDGKNLLTCLLAERIGVERTVSVVDQYSYIELFERVGVDVAISPREIVSEEITRITRDGGAEKVALVEMDRAEVLEIEVGPGSILVDRPIREVDADLPQGVVIGAITRNDELVVPRGDTVVEVGDHVVAFAGKEVADELAALL